MRIPLAEDDPRMSALLQRGLHEEGHTVTVILPAGSGTVRNDASIAP